MKVTNDYYNHKLEKKWEHEAGTIYMQDGRGAWWSVTATENGLAVRSMGTIHNGDDAVRVQPICANEIRLASMRYEEF